MTMRDRIKRMESINIDKIVGFAGGNPKKRGDKERRQLAASLDTHGYVLPVAVRELDDGRFELIDGHGRVEQIRDGRATEIKVIVLDVSSVAEGRRVLLALQQTAAWDTDALEGFVRDALEDGTSLDEIAATSGLTAADLDALGEAGLVELERMDAAIADGTSTLTPIVPEPPAPKPKKTRAANGQALIYKLVITCKSEQEQGELLERLEADGLTVAPLIV